MKGRRVYPNAEGHLVMAEGDYGRDNSGKWFWRPPGCHMGTGDHQVTEHEDGTITVSPSILHHEPPRPDWHGFLERGVWRAC